MMRFRWILIFSLGIFLASPAFAGSKAGAGVVGWQDRKSELERQIAAGQAELERINEINSRLDKYIAYANIGDIVVSNGLRLVPYGRDAYAAGKVIGFVVLGKTDEAFKTGFIAVTSKFDPFHGLDEFYDVLVVLDSAGTLLSE